MFLPLFQRQEGRLPCAAGSPSPASLPPAGRRRPAPGRHSVAAPCCATWRWLTSSSAWAQTAWHPRGRASGTNQAPQKVTGPPLRNSPSQPLNAVSHLFFAMATGIYGLLSTVSFMSKHRLSPCQLRLDAIAIEDTLTGKRGLNQKTHPNS